MLSDDAGRWRPNATLEGRQSSAHPRLWQLSNSVGYLFVCCKGDQREAGNTVNVRALLVPLAFSTETLCRPAVASEGTVTVSAWLMPEWQLGLPSTQFMPAAQSIGTFGMDFPPKRTVLLA